MFINEYDLFQLQCEVDNSPDRPNAAKAVTVLESLIDWTNNNSDGWPYWPKPSRAARSLTDRLYRDFLGRYDQREPDDITDAELTKMFSPIKAFLTRQGVAHDVVFGALKCEACGSDDIVHVREVNS